MTDKHTAGPWTHRRCPGESSDQIDGPDMMFTIADVNMIDPGRTGIADVGGYGESERQRLALPGECEANARLIAAAPDLLAALEAVMKEFGPGTMSDEAFSGAVAALSKAKGETT